MRKVLINGMLCIASILSTGCSLLSGANEGNIAESYWNIPENTIDKEMPNHYELNDNSKYENPTAKHASESANTHSEETKDVASFEIGMLPDGETFLYGYSIGVKGGSPNGTRAYVYCVVAYQYDAGNLCVIHESKYSRTKVIEDDESFYLQICDREGSGDPSIFVYDNGIGYLYELGGTLEFSTDIEGHVCSHFSKAYLVSVINTLTDGANRIYVGPTIEKTAIDLGEAMEENETTSEEDADEAAERLEKETADKTVELALFYDFAELDSDTIADQMSAALDNQIKVWQNMIRGKTYTAKSDAHADWVAASIRVPGQQKIASLDYTTMDSKAKPWFDSGKIDYNSVNSNDMPTSIWKNGPKFGSFDSEGYVCNFLPKQGAHQGFTDLKIKTKLENMFIFLNGEYYEVYGTAGDKTNYCDSVTTTRSYTCEYEATAIDQNGNEIQETSTEVRTQGFTVHRKRHVRVTAPYLEGCGTLEPLGIDHVNGVADDQVLCQKRKQPYWLKRDETLISAKTSIGEDYLLDLTEDGKKLYYLVPTPESLTIVGQNNGSTRKWLIGNEKLDVDKIDLYETSSAVDQAYVTALGHMTPGQSPWMRVTSHRLQKTSIQADNSVLQQLSAQGVDASGCKTEGEGFLLTTLQNGLPYHDLDASLAVNLDAGTWYGTRKKGNKFVSAGFENKDTSYSTLDVALARVEEYDSNESYKESLKNLLVNAKSRSEQLEAKRAQEIQESIVASTAAEKSKETVEDMMDTRETRTAETDASILELGIRELID